MKTFTSCATVRGATHVKKGLSCEDASGILDMPEASAYAFAVADGHGDPSCLRSAYGSQIAVDVALETLSTAAFTYDMEHESLQLGKRVVDEWLQRVNTHISECPLTSDELKQLDEQTPKHANVEPAHLYGTTVVAGLKLHSRLILLQQGDGCCVLLDATGKLSCPIPEDEQCVGALTTSLCDRDAASRIRVASVDLNTAGFAACFVGTDGIDKSLGNIEGLYTFCAKISLDSLGNPSRASFDQLLKNYLTQLTERGSGDDVSLAGCIDINSVAACAAELVDWCERVERGREQESIQQQLISMQRRYERYLQESSLSEREIEERKRFIAQYEQLEERLDKLKGPEVVQGKTAEDEQVSTPKSAQEVALDSPSVIVASNGDAHHEPEDESVRVVAKPSRSLPVGLIILGTLFLITLAFMGGLFGGSLIGHSKRDVGENVVGNESVQEDATNDDSESLQRRELNAKVELEDSQKTKNTDMFEQWIRKIVLDDSSSRIPEITVSLDGNPFVNAEGTICVKIRYDASAEGPNSSGEVECPIREWNSDGASEYEALCVVWQREEANNVAQEILKLIANESDAIGEEADGLSSM